MKPQTEITAPVKRTTQFATVQERQTWGHVGVFDVIRYDGVTLVTFASREQADNAVQELQSVYMVGRKPEPEAE
jgi:hypothetical protein